MRTYSTNKMKQISTIVLALILFLFTKCGQTKTDNETYTRIDSYLSELEKIMKPIYIKNCGTLQKWK